MLRTEGLQPKLQRESLLLSCYTAEAFGRRPFSFIDFLGWGSVLQVRARVKLLAAPERRRATCRGRRRDWRVASSGSSCPKTAEPATIHSAPWRTTSPTLFTSIPPSTSICTFKPRESIILRSRLILSSEVLMKDCPPNPGLTDITST